MEPPLRVPASSHAGNAFCRARAYSEPRAATHGVFPGRCVAVSCLNEYGTAHCPAPGPRWHGHAVRTIAEGVARRHCSACHRVPPDRALSLTEHAEWVGNRLPQGKPVLLAESFSGLVALTLLAEAPSRFQSVIFVGCFAEPPGTLISRLTPLLPKAGTLMRAAPAFLLREYCLGKGATVDQLNRVEARSRRYLPRSTPTGSTSSRSDIPSAAGNSPSPVTISSLPPIAWSRHAARNGFKIDSRHATVTKVDGPHFLLETRPAECAGILARIVR